MNLAYINDNFILSTDSYKYSMFRQYPANSEIVYSYIESRGGDWNKTVFFGLQAYIQRYLLNPITMENIDEAEEIVLAHGEPFYREGWEYIVNEHGGRLPILIRAIPEGTVIDTKNVLVTIQNTDPKCWWLTTFVETSLLRGIWYPTTVATNSYVSKEIIFEALKKSGDVSGLPFKLHDFGARGVSSGESAALGGMGHLVNFLGTDTSEALVAARRAYKAKMAGFSIPAAEHSTITSWGRKRESEAYRNMLRQFAKPGAIVAVVSDSYDIYNAVSEIWGKELIQEVIDSGATVVIRPDSGDPAVVVTEIVRKLDERYGSVVNDKGYKVLNNVRVIQGDGINHGMIKAILFSLHMAGFSSDNVAFGQGGALLQAIDRDTLKFAMKCSAIKIGGEWVEVYKDPITDQGKKSKRGRVECYIDGNGNYVSGEFLTLESAMSDVYRDGELLQFTTFDEIRERANKKFAN